MIVEEGRRELYVQKRIIRTTPRREFSHGMTAPAYQAL